MFLILLKLFLFLAALFFFGWQFCRRVLGLNKIYLLFPLSFVLGIVFYSFFLNATSYFIPVIINFKIVLLVLLLSSFLIKFYLKDNEKLEWGIAKKQIITLGIFWMALTVFFGLSFSATFAFDESSWHNPLISTVANGNFPPKLALNPEIYTYYHYGPDLFVAAISNLTGLPVWWSLDIALLIGASFTFLLVFAFVYFLTQNFAAGFLSAILLYFAGGFKYLVAFLNRPKTIWLWDWLREGVENLLSQEPMVNGYFHMSRTEIYGVVVHHLSANWSMLVLASIIVLFVLFEKNKKIIYLISFAIMGSFLALTAETAFFVFFFSLFLYKSRQFFKKRISKNEFLIYLSSFFVIGFIALVQGGTITDGLIHSRMGGVGSEQLAKISLRENSFLLAHYGYWEKTYLGALIIFVLEWGLPLLALPWVIKFLRKRKDKYFNLLFLISLIAFFIPVIFSFGIKDSDLLRFGLYANFIWAILLGVYWGKLWQRKKFRRAIVALVIIFAVQPIMFNIMNLPANAKAVFLSPFYGEGSVPRGISFWHPPFKDIDGKIGDEMKKALPPGSRIFTDRIYEVAELWGQYAPWARDDYLFYKDEPNENYKALINDFNSGNLKNLKIDYVYLTPSLRKLIGKDENYFNDSKDIFEKIAEYEEGEEIYIIYKVL